MAKKKASNLKRAREEADAAATAEEAAPKKKKKAKAKRKSKKAAVEAKKKLYWGVISQSLKRVAVFEFDQKAEAEKRAKDLSKNGKSPHFVQKVKQEIVEE